MTVDAEIHVPGLDMNPNRWSHHLMFLEEVHAKIRELILRANEGYEAQGRGTLNVTREQWIVAVRQAVEKSPDAFPCSYMGKAEAKNLRLGIASKSVIQWIADYDPERQFILTVEHHPGGSLSVYVLSPE